MPVPNQTYLPLNEELSSPELTVSSPVLKAAGLHMGKYCDNISKEYILCKVEHKGDPRPCINEGKEVTRCGIDFLHQVRDKCNDVFSPYWNCLDRKSNLRLNGVCRKYQDALDECFATQIGVTRPELGYYSKTRLHETSRPKPEFPDKEPPARIPAIPVGNRQPRTKGYGLSGFDF